MTAVISDSPPGACGKAAPRARYAGEEAWCGREPELRIVRDLLRRAQQGAGGVVLVEGEPGIGKSLLLREAVGEAAGQGFPWRREQPTSWAGRSRSSHCARRWVSHSPGSPPTIPIATCQTLPGGGSARYERIWNSGPMQFLS
jgi:hypothetical protein